MALGIYVEKCAVRELLEETGLISLRVRLGPWVENMMEDGQKHYITIFAFIDAFQGEPVLTEPDKCNGWEWFAWNSLPDPLFSPIPSLLAKESHLAL